MRSVNPLAARTPGQARPGRNLTAAQTWPPIPGWASNQTKPARAKPIQAKSMQASRPLPVMAQLPQ